MRKAHCKDGKKYMIVPKYGDIEWADKIKDFRVCDLNGIEYDENVLFASIDGNVVRINRNGTKYYR